MLHSSLLSDLTWLDHGFGTRAEALSQQNMASLKQIHSAVVWVAEQPGCVGEGDALVTGHPGVPVSIRTADCYPILLADERNRAVAAVHAGWRGTAARIVDRTVERMHAQFGTEARDLWVAIGPGIGSCCYEVGVEVARQFGLEAAGRIDLAEMNHRQLVQTGVVDSHIEILGGCTKCDARRFHSFRRDQERAGRMVSFIGLQKHFGRGSRDDAAPEKRREIRAIRRRGPSGRRSSPSLLPDFGQRFPDTGCKRESTARLPDAWD